MVVGIIGWELEVFGCQSLKEKRGVVKSLKARLRQRFNVSVAETAHHDLWQRAELTVAVVANEQRHADSVLAKVDRLITMDGRARIIDSYRQFY